MAEYIEYTTKEGDRWDLIAFRCYGDAHAYADILAANPNLPIRGVLDAGLRVLVPVRAATPAASALPPWKR